MVRASCHCGSVNLEIDAAPAEVTECNCSVCRRYGVLWAYYLPGRVRVLPRPAHRRLRGERQDHRIPSLSELRLRVALVPVDRERDRMGVNARLLEPEVLAGARVRHLDGADTDEYID
jgi:hypothetical protein